MDHQDYAYCAEKNATEVQETVNSSVCEEAYDTMEKSKADSSKDTDESENVISPDGKIAFTHLNWGAVNNAITKTVENGRNLMGVDLLRRMANAEIGVVSGDRLKEVGDLLWDT